MDPITLGLIAAAGFWYWQDRRKKERELSRKFFQGKSGTKWSTVVDRVSRNGQDVDVSVQFPLPTTDTSSWPKVISFSQSLAGRRLTFSTTDPKYQGLLSQAGKDFEIITKAAGYLSY